MAEKLVDVEESFQLWRFRHLKTVERTSATRRGTGGSSGVGFLQARARPLLLSRADRRAHGDRRAMTPVDRRRRRIRDAGPGHAIARRRASAGGAGLPRAADRSRYRARISRRSSPACSGAQRDRIYLANHSLGRPLDAMEDDVREGLAAWYARMGDAWDAGTRKCDAYRARLAALLGAPRADCVVPKTSAGQGLRAVLNTYDRVAARRRDARRVRFARRDPARICAARADRADVRRAARRRRLRRGRHDRRDRAAAPTSSSCRR